MRLSLVRRLTLTQYFEQYEDQTVVAVSHGGFIANALITLFDIPRPGTGTWLDLDNTGLTGWRYADSRWALVQYNNRYHLTGRK
jgi:broad specificity phosphatase PhoE